MGYDMYVVDQEGREVAGDGMYFRRNASGGVALANRLIELEMGYWPAGLEMNTQPKLPANPAGAEWIEDGSQDGRWAGLRADEFVGELHGAMRATFDERPGIAVHKLCGSNDGWWVTKSECESALKLWERAGRPEVDPYGDVIPFLLLATAHEGFRVW